MAIKLFLPGRFDRLAVVFYLAIGWSGMVVIRGRSLDTLPPVTLWLILAGGIVYSCGVVFFVWRGCASRTRSGTVSSSPAQACICAAVMDCLVIARF